MHTDEYETPPPGFRRCDRFIRKHHIETTLSPWIGCPQQLVEYLCDDCDTWLSFKERNSECAGSHPGDFMPQVAP